MIKHASLSAKLRPVQCSRYKTKTMRSVSPPHDLSQSNLIAYTRISVEMSLREQRIVKFSRGNLYHNTRYNLTLRTASKDEIFSFEYVKYFFEIEILVA